MILCDLPYGTTACSWDEIIPFEPLWEAYNRVCKETGIVVLTASQPFTTKVINSNIDDFRYDWIWVKNIATQHMNAKFAPLRNYENVIVFYAKRGTYNPQGLVHSPQIKKNNKQAEYVVGNVEKTLGNGALRTPGNLYTQEFTNYPRQTLYIDVNTDNRFHPTQKPVALFEYLIRTYTNEGETVLDNCAGSGTTAIAAMNTKRKWICMEQDETYFEKSCERIKNHVIVDHDKNWMDQLG